MHTSSGTVNMMADVHFNTIPWDGEPTVPWQSERYLDEYDVSDRVATKR